MMSIKPFSSDLSHLTEQELLDGGYTVMLVLDESKNVCPNCGDDRTGKGSLIASTSKGHGQSFCNEVCCAEWEKSQLVNDE